MPDDASAMGAYENSSDPDATLGSGTAAATAKAPERKLPQSFGRYRIVRLLGEGGMGSVYEAEQDQPRRRVALKVIKTAWASPELFRRFEQESQTLGRLHHPGIAQIYEAGTADSGFGFQPYFAMELIQGKPLGEYAGAKQLNTRQRLALMIQVCDAVQHAHQRGIIHRDLKPSNILVDENGQPKILDFGLARATDSDARATRQTDMGQLLGTLAYMSPEQVLADPQALDTRSDVYALGVILYELLAGKLPYPITQQVHEAVQTIRQSDPAPLSSVSRVYRGDIETIVAKALEKDRERRYASAADLAADIQRYLEDKPIAAKPASTIYQLQKFARRHKALVVGSASVFVALAAGVVVSTREAVRARAAEQAAIQQRDRATTAENLATAQRDRAAAAENLATSQRDRAVAAEARAEQERNLAVTEKQRADSEAASANAVNDFLENDLLAQASTVNQFGPAAKPDPDIKVRTVLDRAATRIAGKFEKQPKVEASIRDTIARSYMGLGLDPQARKQLERALELHRREEGSENPKTLATVMNLGRIDVEQAKYAEAEKELNQTLEIQRRVLGSNNRDTLTTMNNLAALYYDLGKFPQAEALNSQALEIRTRVLGPEDPDTLNSMGNLANDYFSEGKYQKAEALEAKILEISRRNLGPEHPSTLSAIHNLSNIYRAEGKYPQAEALDTQVVETRRRVLGPEHPDTLTSMENLSTAYYLDGKYPQAEALINQTLEIQRRILGAEHPDTLNSTYSLANIVYVQGRIPEAESLFRMVVEARTHALGSEHADTLAAMDGLANVYSAEGKYAEAEPLFVRTLEAQRRILGPEHKDTMVTANNLAGLYSAESKHAQAEEIYRQNLEVQRRVLGDGHIDTLISASNLTAEYYAEGKYAQGEALLTPALEADRRILGPAHPNTLAAMDNLAETLDAEGKHAQAEQLFKEAVEASRRVLGPAHPITLSILTDAAYMYQQQGKYETAGTDAAQILAARRKTVGSQHPDTMASANDLVLAYISQGKFPESEPLAREAVETEKKIQPEDWQRFRAESLLGASLAGQKKYAEAEPLLLEGYQGMVARKIQMGVPYLYHLDRAREWIARLYEAWGKPEKASEWKQK